MEFALHVPAGRVGTFVEVMTTFARLAVPHQRDKLIPDGAVELIVDLGDRPKRLFSGDRGPAGTDFRRAWISGMQLRPLVIEAQPQSSLFVIRFRSGGAFPIIGTPAEALTGGVYGLDALAEGLAASLRDRLLAAPTVGRRFAAAEGWVLERLGATTAIPGVVAHLTRRLANPAGLRVGALAEEVGLTQRQVLTLFRRHVGLTPKQYARVFRFQRLLASLSAGRGTAMDDVLLVGDPLAQPNWAGLALASGYADQAHLGHEFQAFAGMSPGAYVSAFRGLRNYLPIRAEE